MSTRSTGNRGEDLAVSYLQEKRMTILGRNLHYRWGEIDILAQDKNCVVVVEVKAKKSLSQGAAVEMITHAKQQTLRQLAKLIQAEYNKPVRVDVIAIDNFGSTPAITYYQNAIEE